VQFFGFIVFASWQQGVDVDTGTLVLGCSIKINLIFNATIAPSCKPQDLRKTGKMHSPGAVIASTERYFTVIYKSKRVIRASQQCEVNSASRPHLTF
jgi:hypothetical protein